MSNAPSVEKQPTIVDVVEATEAEDHYNAADGAVNNANELRQGFSFPSLLAVGLVLGGGWGTFVQVLPTVIPYGGNVAIFWGQWVAYVGMQCTYLSLAEMASRWPSSSGPQEWAFQLYSPKYKRFASYAMAWLLSIQYSFLTMACSTLEARQIAGLINYFRPTFIPTQPIIWAINAGFIVLCALINIFGIRPMHYVQTIMLVLIVIAFVVWMAAPIARSPTRATAKQVFTETLNLSGWGDFTAFMISLLGSAIGYGTPDTVSHLSEETARPEWDVPRVMAIVPIITVTMASAVIIPFSFCGVDLTALLQSPTGVPYIEFLSQTLRSPAGVAGLSSLILFGQFIAIFECTLAGSRTLFTFAREGGAVFPKQLRVVHPKLQVPVGAIVFNMFFCLAFSLILLGSDLALNSLLGCSAVVVVVVSLALIIPHMLKGRRMDTKGPFHLGKYGWILNTVAVVYLALVLVFFHFPYTQPFDKNTMNYNCVIMPGLVLLGGLAWVVSGRRRYMIHRSVE